MLVGGSRGDERQGEVEYVGSRRPGDIGETTVKELYDKTLKVLCKWLPKLMRNITFEGCVEGGKKAAR